LEAFYNTLPRVTAIVGSFGSGKSEFSINLALQLAERRPGRVALVDLDLVNAYFRSREVRDFLLKKSIKPVVPPGELLYADLPVYGPGINALVRDPEWNVILDVGGDDMGATALGVISGELRKAESTVLMVVNPYRPFTRTVEEIAEMRAGIERASGLKVNALISNPNLGMDTTVEVCRNGHRVVRSAAGHMNLPVIGLGVLRKFLETWGEHWSEDDVPLFPLDLYLSPEWLHNG